MTDNKVEATFHPDETFPEGVELVDAVSPHPEVTSEEAFIKAVKDSLPPSHAISMSVHVRTPEEFERIWLYMQHNSAQMGRVLPYVSVTSVLLDGLEDGVDEEEPEKLHYDEATLRIVFDAIQSTLGDHVQARTASVKVITEDVINALQNAGILFRERR